MNKIDNDTFQQLKKLDNNLCVGETIDFLIENELVGGKNPDIKKVYKVNFDCTEIEEGTYEPYCSTSGYVTYGDYEDDEELNWQCFSREDAITKELKRLSSNTEDLERAMFNLKERIENLRKL